MKAFTVQCLLLALAVVVVSAALPVSAHAQVERVSVRNGWWHDPLTWSPSGVPTLDDIAIVQPDHRVHVRAPAAAGAIVNYGVIDHPQGHITSDRRVTILLMVGAIDSLVNYGEIYGYNAPGGGTDRNEIVPASLLLTVTGDPMSPLPVGRLANWGLIRAGDGYVRRWSDATVIEPGGGVVARGRPRVWTSWPGSTWVSDPDIRFSNAGDIWGGRGLGVSDTGPGGDVVVGWSPFARDVDAPYCPYREIRNPGVIQGGAFGGLGGSTFLASADVFRPGTSGGAIDGDGGWVLAGEGMTTGFISCALADNISFSGPGTRLEGGFMETMIGWDPFTAEALSISLTDLDEDAVFARQAQTPSLSAAGSRVNVVSSVIDMQGNPAGTVVLHAEDGLTFPADIVVAAGTLFLDPGVELRDITQPPVDPWPLLRGRDEIAAGLTAARLDGFAAGLGGANRDHVEPAIVVQPACAPPDTMLTIPGHGLGSPGDTVGMWYHVKSNTRLSGDVEITVTDSLGYYILNGFQTVSLDTFPFAVVEIDVVIPPWAEFGTADRIDVRATYVDSPSVYFDLRDRLHVVPTVNVIAEFPVDGFFPGSQPFDGTIDLLVRNEGREPAHFDLSVWDTEGWYLYPEFTDCWLPARSDTVLPVNFDIPGWAQSGDVDTVYVRAQEVFRGPNRDEVHVEVDYDTQTGIDEPVQAHHLALTQNFPNPFSPRTEIRFALPQAGSVTLDVYDVAGRLVRSIVSDRRMPAGEHLKVWDGRNERGQKMPSGIYFCRLKVADGTVTKKMALVR